jgi:tetratricopeptide (TPR) repeat protein
MSFGRKTFGLTIVLAALLLGGCMTPAQRPVVYSGTAPEVVEQMQPPGAPAPDPFQRARLLADILYDARLAYEDNRLMTPAGRSAFDRYIEVLNLDPGNAVALQGIQEIVLRYIELADVAMSQGQYDSAASLLARGASLNPDRPELAEARQRLAVARETRLESFTLDPRGLSSQSPEMLNKLAEIARHIKQQEATFQILARNDDEGRWIYKVMREAVDGYRLRGNIGIAGTPTILVTPRPG